MLFRQRREPPPPLPESVPPLPRKDPSLIGPTNIIAEIFEEKCLQAEIFCKRKRRRPEQPASLSLYGGKCLSLSEAPCGAITVSVGDFASRRTCAGTHGVLFAALPGSAGADEYIVAEMEPAKGKGGKFLTKRHEKNRNFPAYGRDATTRRPTASSTSTFHFPLTGEMQRRKTESPNFHFPLTGEMQRKGDVVAFGIPAFHFPLTGEMQRRGRRRNVARPLSFISRPRARCNDTHAMAVTTATFSFPAHGRDATAVALAR